MTSLRWDLLKANGRAPVLPEGLRLYVISDVHGCDDLLEDLLGLAHADRSERPTVRAVFLFLGDYIDRGPASRQVIDRLLDLSSIAECVFLRGNHELVATRCLTDQRIFDQWLRLGGVETLQSYGVRFRTGSQTSVSEMQAQFYDAISMSQHLAFYRGLEDSFVCGDFFFAHAGIKPRVPLNQQKQNDLLWIREEFLSSRDDFGKVVVHGHTPVAGVEVRHNRINIDTGAFASGCLTCLVLENDGFKVLDTRPSPPKPLY